MAEEPDGAGERSARDELVWELPAGDRPGKVAWLGPISAALGLLSWLTPVGAVVALVACVCGVVSIVTRRPYRIDWTAVVGICLGAGHLALELVLFAMSSSGL